MAKNLKNIDDLSIATIRSLCIDAINKANSGHPGMCLGAAPIIYTLYKDFLVSDPKHPDWINRDRFVLSAGHGSMLLYSMLHLCGYNLSMDDIKEFRQLKSKTPGHPEVGVTEGVDASGGPLGQGIAQAVGMAIAETKLQAMYGKEVYDHYTYVLCGDGCLEEGISQEAIVFAGLNKLNKLILLYDRNNVTLDGPLAQSSNEDVINRFLAANWNVIYCPKGNSYKKIKSAIKTAKRSKNKPTIIVIDTVIGFGSKNEGKCKVHGSPLGAEDGRNAKLSYGYDYPEFTVLDEVYKNFKDTFAARGAKAYEEYQNNFKKLDAKTAERILDLSTNDLRKFVADSKLDEKSLKKNSTRNSSGEILNYYHKLLPNFIGGSADVAGSVKTALKDGKTWSSADRNGTNFNWGIREFFMSSAANGILLHGGLRTYVGSFLVFSDYCKAAIRMSALEKVPAIYLFSHDSLAVGEDGPTHEPVEQLAMLRSIPNVNVFRPCDAKETFASYKIALEETETPSALILTRQDLPLLDGSDDYEKVKKGAYVVAKENGALRFTLIASGSEVSLALEIKEKLEKLGAEGIRVVSMPCTRLFDKQSLEYKLETLGGDYSRRAFIEMATTFGLHKYAKYAIGIDDFGYSGKADDVINAFGFNADAITKRLIEII